MKYLYIYNYKDEYEELCQLELSSIFSEKADNRHIISTKSIDVELSCFIKYKIEIEAMSDDFAKLLTMVEGNEAQDFLVSFVETYKQEKVAKEFRNNYCKQLGMKFKNYVNFDNPSVHYALTIIDGIYYFGKYQINHKSFKQRNKKPYSYSNSLDIVLSKTALNIITKGDFNKTIIDPCCGVGTVVIEGIYQGYKIMGNDINYKVVESANNNLQYFNLDKVCKVMDIRKVDKKYDCLIIDLPYGLFSLTTDEYTIELLNCCKNIAKDIAVISAKEIEDLLNISGLKITEKVKIKKQTNRDFSRYMYIVK